MLLQDLGDHWHLQVVKAVFQLKLVLLNLLSLVLDFWDSNRSYVGTILLNSVGVFIILFYDLRIGKALLDFVWRCILLIIFPKGDLIL